MFLASLYSSVSSVVEILSRITETFTALKRDGKKGFIPFITAGDPDLQTIKDLIIELARAGATLIELGIPFSDPMADGPVIQRASERALRHGFGIDDVLQIVSDTRKETDVPIILLVTSIHCCNLELRGSRAKPKAPASMGYSLLILFPKKPASSHQSFAQATST